MNVHPIGYVSQVTGLTPHVIRAWERRHNAVSPKRLANNRRVYSDADIDRLNTLRRAIQNGHRIGHLAALHTDHIRSYGTPPETRTRGYSTTLRSREEHPMVDDAHMDRAMMAIARLDSAMLSAILASSLSRMPKLRWIRDFITPLFERVGEKWSRGDLRVVHENMASSTVQSMLWDLLVTAPLPAPAGHAVVATPAGQWCTIGAMSTAVIVRDIGWHSHFFGPNLPGEEISAAATALKAQAVILSMTCDSDAATVPRQLRLIGHTLPPDAHLFVGGRAAGPFRQDIEAVGGLWVKTIGRLLTHLQGVSQQSTSSGAPTVRPDQHYRETP